MTGGCGFGVTIGVGFVGVCTGSLPVTGGLTSGGLGSAGGVGFVTIGVGFITGGVGCGVTPTGGCTGVGLTGVGCTGG